MPGRPPRRTDAASATDPSADWASEKATSVVRRPDGVGQAGRAGTCRTRTPRSACTMNGKTIEVKSPSGTTTSDAVRQRRTRRGRPAPRSARRWRPTRPAPDQPREQLTAAGHVRVVARAPRPVRRTSGPAPPVHRLDDRRGRQARASRRSGSPARGSQAPTCAWSTVSEWSGWSASSRLGHWLSLAQRGTPRPVAVGRGWLTAAMAKPSSTGDQGRAAGAGLRRRRRRWSGGLTAHAGQPGALDQGGRGGSASASVTRAEALDSRPVLRLDRRPGRVRRRRLVAAAVHAAPAAAAGGRRSTAPRPRP